MKLSPDLSSTVFRNPPSARLKLCIGLLSVGAFLGAWPARASLPQWLQDVVSGSQIEDALYRLMELPGGKVLYPRPPKEAQKELSSLIDASSADAELYCLRAEEAEGALDFKAAEANWQTYAKRAKDTTAAKLALADYYHRRLQPNDEIKVLMEVGSATPSPGQELKELYIAPSEQTSWKAFERGLLIIADQGLDLTKDRSSADKSYTAETYRLWIARYPQQGALYEREFRWLLDQRRFDQASDLLIRYRKVFPEDKAFPTRASALIEYQRGSVDSVNKALAVYEQSFEPLWPAGLVHSYYELLQQTRTERSYLAKARAALAANPDDLKAMARLFYAAQQAGNLPAAQQVVDTYRASKESRQAQWSAEELYTLAQLTEAIHAYPEAARYDFALYHVQGSLTNGVSPQEEGLSGMVRLLLRNSEQPIAVGAGNLSMYRDIATLDQGPGYWNGILSLWMNSTSPQQEYHEEEDRAKPYFNRAKAAQLIAILDDRYPKAKARPELHLELIRALAEYGESEAEVKSGDKFLLDFTAPEQQSNRVAVATLMADAYAHLKQTKEEFALYDRMLEELAAQTKGMPLTAAAASHREPVKPSGRMPSAQNDDATSAQDESANSASASSAKVAAFDVQGETLQTQTPPVLSFPAAQEYQLILDRYLGRLTATGQFPQALAMLRKELDRNPNDPLLYERLAAFLEQNNLSAQQEEVFEQAIQKFQDSSWYDKLARLYLREKKREAFARLTKEVTGIFHGTELEAYFKETSRGGPQLFLELNLYAHQRFPHDAVFVQNLLSAYSAKTTRDSQAWEALLREHWSDSEQLRTQFFGFLSRTGKLDAELERLRALTTSSDQQQANPAAARELAIGYQWQSHFEQSAPLLATLAYTYPADTEIGTQASDVYRSLGYYDAAAIDHAVQVETHLLAAYPGDAERLARIGDILAGSRAEPVSEPDHQTMGAASTYWRRIPAVHPGTADGYLEAATIFWDYFEYDDALREINEARARFSNPTLFGYESGAIEEGKRDFQAAIREYTQAATEDAGKDRADASGSATNRLLQLARRAATAGAVDQSTMEAVERHASPAAIDLRERVLEAEKRSAEVAPLLKSVLSKATTFDQVQSIQRQAQAHNLVPVYETALQREIDLSSDAVEKIQLTYELARSYEDRKDFDDARKLIDQEYRDNPKLLGVVRATTDFYWRNKQPATAIKTLLDSAKLAQPALKIDLLVEAASKANQSGSYDQARLLMAPLVDSKSSQKPSSADTGINPYDARYISIVANSYALAGDDRGLKQFYLDELAALSHSSPLSADERKRNTVLMRRGLIPALTRMKDYADAIDQYIEILHAYPEDANAIQEAALYAVRYEREAQLIDSVIQTTKDSPRDARYAIMLAQMQTTMEHYPEAVDAYARAIAIRSDRSDVYAAKAELDERLQRFDDACQDYQKLYTLTYQDPSWMVKVATVRARQARKDETIKALERAWIDGHPASAANYFRVATQLEQWRMLEDALRFAELGVKAEGDDLLAGGRPGNESSDDAEGAATFARLATRLRQQETAIDLLDRSLVAADQSSNAPSIVIEQVEKHGVGSVTDDQWRKRRAEVRKSTATQRYRSALIAMGEVVSTYFTPEEKQRFAQLVDRRWQQAKATQGSALTSSTTAWIEVAKAAGLAPEEASLRQQALLEPASKQRTSAEYEPLLALERARMVYPELADTLARYAKVSKPAQRQAARIAEADAYRDAGDEGSEMRVLGEVGLETEDNAFLRERYLSLLLKRDPKTFESYGAFSKQDTNALAAPNYATLHGNAKLAEASLNVHLSTFGPLWQHAYAALVGLYFRGHDHQQDSETQSAFHAVLGDEKTVGDRVPAAIATPGSTKAETGSGEATLTGQTLTGKTWFYYAMRFGVFESQGAHEPTITNAEDTLPAGLEASPANSDSYVDLAEAYADSGDAKAALVEYRHGLELASHSPLLHDAIAMLLWQAGERNEAFTSWRMALSDLNQMQDQGPAPETFWSSYSRIASRLGTRKLTGHLHADLDGVIRSYLARNGNYRSSELLEAVFKASADNQQGIDWVLSLSEAAHDPAAVLADIDQAPWLSSDARESVLLREVALASVAAQNANPNETFLKDRALQLRKTLTLLYVRRKQDDKATALLTAMTADERKDGALVKAQIELAARAGKLDPLLTGYRELFTAQQDSPTMLAGAPAPPELQLLREAAQELSAHEDKQDALTLWNFIFEMGQKDHALMSADYLGLAEAHLELDHPGLSHSGDVTIATELLHRMTSQPGDLYASSDQAATLLEKHGRALEAIGFLTVMAKGVPWDASFELRLAKAQLEAGKTSAGEDNHEAIATLESLAANNAVDYEQRALAALAIAAIDRIATQRKPVAAPYGSEELSLLARGKITPAEARQPYFITARAAAAKSSLKASEKAALLREALAYDPNGTASNSIRFKTFQAEESLGHHATALAAIQPLLMPATGESEASAGTEEAADFEGARGLESIAPGPQQFLTTNSEKLQFALQMANVYEGTNAPGDALNYLKLALYLSDKTGLADQATLTDKTRLPISRTDLERRIALIQTAFSLEAGNIPRRPKIQRGLEQSVLVKPMLTSAQLALREAVQ